LGTEPRALAYTLLLTIPPAPLTKKLFMFIHIYNKHRKKIIRKSSNL
jgi:hypothetical protein